MKFATNVFLALQLLTSVNAWTSPFQQKQQFLPVLRKPKNEELSKTALHYLHDRSPNSPPPVDNRQQRQMKAPATKTPTTRVGEKVLNGKYLLTGYIPVPSPKCEIYKAYPLHPKTGEVIRHQPLIVKFSHSNVDLEYANYQKLFTTLSPQQRECFVSIHDRIPGSAGIAPPVNSWGQPTTSPTKQRTTAQIPSKAPGIVMERGYDNLRVFIKKNGAYKGDDLRKAFQSVISSVHALHSNGWIWTELKPENFVVTPKGIKGIDLESIIPTKELLQVYTAEACPPEFPIDEMYVTLPEMRVTEPFDVWGLGLVLFEMATGQPFYAEGLTDIEFIKDKLRHPEQTLQQLGVSKLAHIEPDAARLILACLRPQPQERASCAQLLASPYFSPIIETTASASTKTTDTFVSRQSSTSTKTQLEVKTPIVIPASSKNYAVSRRESAINTGNSKGNAAGSVRTTSTTHRANDSESPSILKPNTILTPAHAPPPRRQPIAKRYNAIESDKAKTKLSQRGRSTSPIYGNGRPKAVRWTDKASSASSASPSNVPSERSTPTATRTTRTTLTSGQNQPQSQKQAQSTHPLHFKQLAQGQKHHQSQPKQQSRLTVVHPSQSETTIAKSNERSIPKQNVDSGASSTSTVPSAVIKIRADSKSEASVEQQQQELFQRKQQQKLCWKLELERVLDNLANHAQEDPEMAYDLVSILDEAKEKVLPTPTPTVGY